jgi:RNA-binding protein 39
MDVDQLLEEAAAEREQLNRLSHSGDEKRRDRDSKDGRSDRDRARDRSRERRRERESDRYRESNSARDKSRERRRGDETRPRSSNKGADTDDEGHSHRRDEGRDRPHDRDRSRDRHRGSRRDDRRSGDYYSGSGRARSRSPRRGREDGDRYRSDRDRSRERRRRDDDRRGSARPTASPKTPEPTEDDRDKRTIFVQQISQRAEMRHLRSFFEVVGPVVEAQIVKDRVTGRSKG